MTVEELRREIVDYVAELRARKATYHSVEAGLAVGRIVDEIEGRFAGGTRIRRVAEPVFAFGERGE